MYRHPPVTKRPAPLLPYTTLVRAETGRRYQDRERMRSLILGGLQEARRASDEKAVVMGYCFGGAAALELARSGKAEGIAGYVSFHGGLATPEDQEIGRAHV